MTHVILQKGDFMKKQLTVALGLAVLATPAFATKARLQALGEDVNGSFYVNDNRNVFLNPAQVNNHRDLVTFEFGDTTQATDSTTNPRAEGGVFTQAGNLVYGVQFGSESNTSNSFRAAAGLTAADVLEENNIDLFVGGDSGIKWGANATYSKSAKDELNGDAKQDALRTRFGAIMGDTSVHAGLNISNKAEDSAGNEFKGKLGYRLGAVHAWNGYSLFADWQSNDGEGDIAGTKSDIKVKKLQFGAGRVARLNDRANLFSRVQFTMDDAENEGSTAVLTACSSITCEEYKAKYVPVVVGLETEATSWLTLRASVQQTLWGAEEDKSDKRPFHETTVVNAGASLKFGELAIDGVVGNSTGATGAAGASTATGKGSLRTDELMTRVGMTYRF